MFGRKKKNIEKGDHKRILSLLKKSMKDGKKTEKLAELLGCSSDEVKADCKVLTEYIKNLEYLSSYSDRSEKIEGIYQSRRSKFGHNYFDL